jgi:hypothetical protein
VLNLDIAWCYLCLRSVTHIPDAEQRLRKCEQNLHQSYGPNLERLLALKGTTGNDYTFQALPVSVYFKCKCFCMIKFNDFLKYISHKFSNRQIINDL